MRNDKRWSTVFEINNQDRLRLKNETIITQKKPDYSAWNLVERPHEQLSQQIYWQDESEDCF